MNKEPVFVTEKILSEHEKKDKALFDSISAKYLEKDLAPQSALARKHRLLSSLRNVPFDHNSRVLEVGCGAGFSVKYLDKPYASYVGVDYSQGLIDYANQYNASPKTQFICANIKEYQSEEKFDIIFMIGVLHHFDDIEEILKYIVNLLKPGGVLVANEPQASNPLIQSMRKLRTKLDKGYSDDQVQLFPKDIKRIFELAILQEVRIFGQGYFSTPFAEVVLPPKWLFKPLASLSKYLDLKLEKWNIDLFKMASWNIVGIGIKPKK